MGNRLAELLFRTQSKIGQNGRDQIFNGVAPSEDLCAGQAAAAEVRLERLDQPAFMLRVEIVFDARRPGEALDLGTAGMPVLFKGEDRAKRFRAARSSREAHELNPAVGQCQRYRAVRSPKVNANGEAGGVR